MGKQSGPPGQYQGGQQGPQGPQMPQHQSIASPSDFLFSSGDWKKDMNNAAEFIGLSAPQSPDYYSAATQSAMSSRPNIDTPFGGQQWAMGPDGQWHLSVGLNGQLGGAADNLSGQAADALRNPLDLSALGDMPDPNAARQQAIDAAYGQATSRLDPMWDKREEATRTRLINQGLDPNSEAARNLTTQEGQARNDAYGSAMNSAIMQGNQAGQMVFNQGMQARQQQLAEMLRQRGGPLAEMAALMQLTQTPNTGPGADYLAAAGMQGNYNLGATDMQNQSRSDAAGGAGDLLSGLLPFLLSDERAKQDIVREESEAIPGVPFASWEYLHQPGVRYRGVIAQDLQRVRPEMVARGADGFLRVNYAALREAIHG